MNLGAARVAPEKAVFRPALPMSFVPGITEIQMATMTYKEQLQHPNWQRKRLEALEAAGFSCEQCGDRETMLHVHHKRYVKGRKAWEYELTELDVLCAPCHESEHRQRDFFDRLILEAGQQGMFDQVVALVAGFLSGAVVIGPEDANAAIDMDGHTYHLGIMASIAGGADWDAMSAAAKILSPKGSYSPAEQQAVDLWSGK